MEVFHSLSSYQSAANKANNDKIFVIATIGTFDGVHLGHRKILQNVLDLAHDIHKKHHEYIEIQTVVITFEPHPRQILLSDVPAPKLLQSLDEKLLHLRQIGINKVLIIPFTMEFARMQSSEFIQNVLVNTLNINQLVIGYDHKFGANRSGGLNELQEAGLAFGFQVSEIPAHQIDDSNVSSTNIRNSIIQGDVDIARKLLGYSYSLKGEVVLGEQRGRKIGYPTANLRLLDVNKLLPHIGVYAVWVKDANSNSVIGMGMLNIGYRPTFGDGGLSLEVHIIDFQGDLYGTIIRIEFVQFVRNEIKFPNIEALFKQLELDKATCKHILSPNKP